MIFSMITAIVSMRGFKKVSLINLSECNSCVHLWTWMIVHVVAADGAVEPTVLG